MTSFNASRPNIGTQIANILDHRWFLPACLLLFVATRIFLVFLLPVTFQFSDAGWYLSRATSIATGFGYSEQGLPTAYWPIGYPGFLGILFTLFGVDPRVGQIANVVLAVGSFFLVVALARHLFRNERVARLSVAFLTVYPNYLSYTPVLLTEIYFTFLVLLAAYLFLVHRDGWSAAACGIIFGIATLTKPQVLFLPAMLTFLALWTASDPRAKRSAIATAAVIYIAMAGVITPWTIRNTVALGAVIPISTNGGATLLTGNNSSARGDYTPDDPLVAQANFSVADQVAADQRARTLAIQWIADHPARFVALIPQKIWRLWAPDGEGEWLYQEGFSGYAANWYWFRAIRMANQLLYVLLLATFAASLVYWSRLKTTTRWPYSLFPYMIAGYLTAISIIFSGQSRFHFPAIPWIMMMVSWFVCQTVLVSNATLDSKSTSRSAHAG